MDIILDESMELSSELRDLLYKAAEACASNEGLDPEICEISLSLVSGEEIRGLNSQFRGIDKETDVLSFPQYDDIGDAGEQEIIPLGDVVICEDVAHRQAEEYGHSYEREFVYLFVHSILHLLGYDHMEEDEKKEMRAAEEQVMQSIGLSREAAAI